MEINSLLLELNFRCNISVSELRYKIVIKQSNIIDKSPKVTAHLDKKHESFIIFRMSR